MTQQLVEEGRAEPGSDPVAQRSYLLCATPRTGSYLLADLLRQTGCAGNPTEYFSSGFQEHWAPRWGTSSYPDYLRRVQQAATTDGVLAVKAHPRQLQHFARQETGLARPSYPEQRAALERWLPTPRYVWLRRRDELRQAISWAKSMQTHVWWDAAEPPAPYDPPAPDALRFDVDFVTGALIRMRREDRMWARFFDENGVRPLVVWYEDLAADRQAEFGRVVDFLGLGELRTRTPPAPSLRRQSDVTSERWARRYAALTRARVEATLSACAGVDVGKPDVLAVAAASERPAGWDESRHSLLALGGYPGPFKPDYRLATEPAPIPPVPRANLRFVTHRCGDAADCEVVLHPRWLAALRRESADGLDAAQLRTSALAAHLGADRVGIETAGAAGRHVDVRGSRVLLLDDDPHGLDIEGFLRLPARPAHERGGRPSLRIAVCLVGAQPPWATALRNCLAALTRHTCDIVGPGDADVLARADILFVAGDAAAGEDGVIAVRALTGARLELSSPQGTRVVPQPIDWWTRTNRPDPVAVETPVVVEAVPGRATLVALARGAAVVTGSRGTGGIARRFAGAPLLVADDDIARTAARLRDDLAARQRLAQAGRAWIERRENFNTQWDARWTPALDGLGALG